MRLAMGCTCTSCSSVLYFISQQADDQSRCLSLNETKIFVQFAITSCASDSREIAAVGISDNNKGDNNNGREVGMKICLGSQPEGGFCNFPAPS